MRFRSRRGRPRRASSRSVPPGHAATPELLRKHRQGVTRDPLDLLLERRWISAEAHQAGLRLRWLHTLHYGAPGVSACDCSGADLPIPVKRSDDWLAAREEEYRAALTILGHGGLRSLALQCCVYALAMESERHASWLSTDVFPHHKALSEGLEAVERHWRRRTAQRNPGHAAALDRSACSPL